MAESDIDELYDSTLEMEKAMSQDSVDYLVELEKVYGKEVAELNKDNEFLRELSTAKIDQDSPPPRLSVKAPVSSKQLRAHRVR